MSCGSAPECSGNGVCESGGCVCNIGFFGQFCDMAISSSSAITAFKLTFIVGNIIVCAAALWRLVAVVFWKFQQLKSQSQSDAASTAQSQQPHRPTRCFSRLRAAVLRSQVAVMVLVAASSAMRTATLFIDPLIQSKAFGPNFMFILQTSFMPLESYVVIRFFGAIQAKFDTATRKTIIAFDVVNWLFFSAFIAMAIAAPFMSAVVVNEIVDAIGAVWSFLLVCGVSVYSVTVLRPARQLQTRTQAAQEAAEARQQLLTVLRFAQVVATGIVITALAASFTEQAQTTQLTAKLAIVIVIFTLELIVLAASVFIMGRVRERAARVHVQPAGDSSLHVAVDMKSGFTVGPTTPPGGRSVFRPTVAAAVGV